MTTQTHNSTKTANAIVVYEDKLNSKIIQV